MLKTFSLCLISLYKIQYCNQSFLIVLQVLSVQAKCNVVFMFLIPLNEHPLIIFRNGSYDYENLKIYIIAVTGCHEQRSSSVTINHQLFFSLKREYILLKFPHTPRNCVAFCEIFFFVFSVS